MSCHYGPGKWVTYKGDPNETIRYTYEAHTFVKMYRSLPWLVCKHCGLLLLRNDFTQWCVSKGCLHEYHPGYKKAMRGV